MRILGVDTSTMTGSVALIEDKKLIGELALNIKETHESRLMRTIDLLFQNTGFTPHDIDLFAVGVGPGSFTGLRIGLATLKALAQASNKPLVGISSLAGMAYSFINARGFLCPLIDARKKEVYTSLFSYTGLQLIRHLPDLVTPPQDALEKIREITRNEPVLFFGSGLNEHTRIVKEYFNEKALYPPRGEPKGTAIALLGLEKWQSNQHSELWEISPNYLRKSEAEIKWAAREKK